MEAISVSYTSGVIVHVLLVLRPRNYNSAVRWARFLAGYCTGRLRLFRAEKKVKLFIGNEQRYVNSSSYFSFLLSSRLGSQRAASRDTVPLIVLCSNTVAYSYLCLLLNVPTRVDSSCARNPFTTDTEGRG